jgi:hypothetical protein
MLCDVRHVMTDTDSQRERERERESERDGERKREIGKERERKRDRQTDITQRLAHESDALVYIHTQRYIHQLTYIQK